MPAIDLLVKRLQARDRLSAAEIEVLQGLPGAVTRYDRRQTIVHAGEAQTKSRIVLDGWVALETLELLRLLEEERLDKEELRELFELEDILPALLLWEEED